MRVRNTHYPLPNGGVSLKRKKETQCEGGVASGKGVLGEWRGNATKHQAGSASALSPNQLLAKLQLVAIVDDICSLLRTIYQSQRRRLTGRRLLPSGNRSARLGRLELCCSWISNGCRDLALRWWIPEIFGRRRDSGFSSGRPPKKCAIGAPAMLDYLSAESPGGHAKSHPTYRGSPE